MMAEAEDVQLRNQAVALMNRARVVSQIQGGPYNFRTEAIFTATASDGSLQSGTYTRVRGSDGALREDLRFGDYSASSISQGVQRAWTNGWNDPPFAGVRIRQLVPYNSAMFDASDVIQEIKSSSYGGRQAFCIEFETIVGEQRLPGEICVDKANGSMLELRSGSKLWEYSKFFSIKSALIPAQTVYREGNFSLDADLTMTALDEKPEDAFVVPSEWTQGTMCHQFQFPVAKSAPQPRGEGAPDAPITSVTLRLHVNAQGTVSSANVLKQARPDLDAEAEKLVMTWIYEPGTCNGHPQEYVINGTVHFQGR
jgi:TonB family protein